MRYAFLPLTPTLWSSHIYFLKDISVFKNHDETTFKMCASSETEQLDICRYTAFKTCVKKRAGHCPDTRDLFRYWNIDEENIHRFSLNEMICVEEAVKAGEEYCPVPKIITALEECLAEEKRKNSTIPSHNNLYVKDNCRLL